MNPEKLKQAVESSAGQVIIEYIKSQMAEIEKVSSIPVVTDPNAQAVEFKTRQQVVLFLAGIIGDLHQAKINSIISETDEFNPQ